jgi:hypothetical protein
MKSVFDNLNKVASPKTKIELLNAAIGMGNAASQTVRIASAKRLSPHEMEKLVLTAYSPNFALLWALGIDAETLKTCVPFAGSFALELFEGLTSDLDMLARKNSGSEQLPEKLEAPNVVPIVMPGIKVTLPEA